jgi:O-antigen ligase
VAAATFEPLWAERIAAAWRPGGPFEYPPALALLEVSALPVLVTAMTRRSRTVAGLGAVGMAVAGGVLALSASRVSLAAAVAVGGLALAAPAVTTGARRAIVAGALLLGLVAGVALQIAAGAPPAAGPAQAVLELPAGVTAAGVPSESAPLAALIAMVALAAPAWLAARRALGGGGRAAGPGTREGSPPRRRGRRPAWHAAAVLTVAAIAGSAVFGAAAGQGAGPAGGFLHGREATWRAALETFADRPLTGTGADAFLAGSARHQGGQTIAFAHDLPLELAAELGVAGVALAIALYLATAIAIHRARYTKTGWLLGPAAAAFLVANLVDWPWHLAGSGAVWALATGALVGVRTRQPKDSLIQSPAAEPAEGQEPRLQMQGDSR